MVLATPWPSMYFEAYHEQEGYSGPVLHRTKSLSLAGQGGVIMFAVIPFCQAEVLKVTTLLSEPSLSYRCQICFTRPKKK